MDTAYCDTDQPGSVLSDASMWPEGCRGIQPLDDWSLHGSKEKIHNWYCKPGQKEMVLAGGHGP